MIINWHHQVRSRSVAKYATRRLPTSPICVPTSRRIPTWSRSRVKGVERPLHSNPTFTNTRRAPAWKWRRRCRTTALVRRRSKPKTIHLSRLSNHCNICFFKLRKSVHANHLKYSSFDWNVFICTFMRLDDPKKRLLLFLFVTAKLLF
jgi:hypothetical protein